MMIGLSSILIVACVCLTAMADSPPECTERLNSVAKLKDLYCDAHVVFTGTPLSAMSGVSTTPEGGQIETSLTDFSVKGVYKGEEEYNVQVMRSYHNQEDQCSAEAFPAPRGVSEIFLVFGTGASGRYDVQACGHRFLWSCVSKKVQKALRRRIRCN
ncbi:uncharacterized protein LOC106011105 [Aplysia californica]|uniref:Uncharacterized protein LOC106011105 n=1 Tax=Aplysia californica TaxID=6500 RepID=A0ABM0ZUY4_APLCA|nr:uncharacterized protein LOC106011105 [Aplysia californica]